MRSSGKCGSLFLYVILIFLGLLLVGAKSCHFVIWTDRLGGDPAVECPIRSLQSFFLQHTREFSNISDSNVSNINLIVSDLCCEHLGELSMHLSQSCTCETTFVLAEPTCSHVRKPGCVCRRCIVCRHLFCVCVCGCFEN